MSALAFELPVARLEELPPGSMRLVQHESLRIGVFNCGGELYAIEDRCTHDDGPLCEGRWEPDDCTVDCPRHGARFDLRSGRPLSLPAYLPARTFPVRVSDGFVSVELD